MYPTNFITTKCRIAGAQLKPFLLSHLPSIGIQTRLIFFLYVTKSHFFKLAKQPTRIIPTHILVKSEKTPILQAFYLVKMNAITDQEH
jgi:hypothetical protein